MLLCSAITREGTLLSHRPHLGGRLTMRPGTPGPIAECPVDRRSRQRRFLFFALFPFVAACSAGLRHSPSITPAAAPSADAASQAAAPPPPTPVEDPVLTLIAQSDEHFKAGQKELELGHVNAARQEFDEA